MYSPNRQYRTSTRGVTNSSVARSPSNVHGLPADRDLLGGVLPSSLHTISKPSLSESDAKVEVKDLACIGSYNWVENSEPTIIVPGSPPEWCDRPVPFKVQSDSGSVFVDQNGFRLPSTPLLPLFEAVDHIKSQETAQPSVDWPSIDFITDRNGLRKLLRWVDGDKDTKEFRIDAQLVGKRTVLLNRWEKRHREQCHPWSWGFNFEKVTTTPAAHCSESTGHHRIVKYDLNGLVMIVRFEVDACMPRPAAPRRSSQPASISDLASTLSSLTISSTTTSPSPVKKSTPHLKIISGGELVPQSDVIELATTSAKRVQSYDWPEKFSQLFFSQTPHHFQGIHRSGQFFTVKKRALDSGEFVIVEQAVQRSLKMLVKALMEIQRIVKKHGHEARLSLICQNGVLKVYAQSSQQSFLPVDTTKRFHT